jgi:ribonuclease III
VNDLLEALGVELPDELLTLALTHRSYAYENGGLPTNERLEFLGDAVLGLNCSIGTPTARKGIWRNCGRAW